jgi:hypothetical protein
MICKHLERIRNTNIGQIKVGQYRFYSHIGRMYYLHHKGSFHLIYVNITLGHADFITTTGVRGPYDWTLPNIVDDDALRSVFLAKTDGSRCPYLMSICKSTPLVRITIGCWIGRAGCHLAGA